MDCDENVLTHLEVAQPPPLPKHLDNQLIQFTLLLHSLIHADFTQAKLCVSLVAKSYG